MRKKPITYPLRVAILFICLPAFLIASPVISADMRDSDSYLKQTIVSLQKAKNTVIERHYLQTKSKAQAAQGEEDLRIFINYLDGRIYHCCQTLLLDGGPDSLKSLPCPTNLEGSMEVNQFDSVPGITGQTSREKVTQLDQELNNVLGEFDEMLLKEQDTVAAHIPRQREGSSSAYAQQNGHATRRDSNSQQVTNNKTDRKHSGKNSSTDSGTQKSTGDTKEGATNQGTGRGKTNQSQLPPTDGPKDLSQTDDDIVARQLREAAEQEADPEVKEKLWEEYRKYKEGVK